jgi:hypothetical protein
MYTATQLLQPSEASENMLAAATATTIRSNLLCLASTTAKTLCSVLQERLIPTLHLHHSIQNIVGNGGVDKVFYRPMTDGLQYLT